jgi:sulfopyruvate decarboxylase subunit alpha
VTVTREGEAFALASGLWIGGAAPLVVVQNTGLLEAGDSLRGTAVRMGAPLPIVVTARGYAKMGAAGFDLAVTVGAPRLDRETLVRPDVDSVALLTEPTLSAWGIPFHRCTRSSAFADDLAAVVASARDERRPHALVLAAGMV